MNAPIDKLPSSAHFFNIRSALSESIIRRAFLVVTPHPVRVALYFAGTAMVQLCIITILVIQSPGFLQIDAKLLSMTAEHHQQVGAVH